MHRLLLEAIKQKKSADIAKLIGAMHPSVLCNLRLDRVLKVDSSTGKPIVIDCATVETVATELIKIGDLQNLQTVLKDHPALMTKTEGATLLALAVGRNQLPIAKFLFAQGCQFASSLHQQVAMETIDLVKPACATQLTAVDSLGNNPFDYVAALGSTEKVNLLLKEMKKHQVEIKDTQSLRMTLINNHTHLLPVIMPVIPFNLDRLGEIAVCLQDDPNRLPLIHGMMSQIADKDKFITRLINNLLVHKKNKLTEAFIKSCKNDVVGEEKIQLRKALLDYLIDALGLINSKGFEVADMAVCVAKGFAGDFRQNPAWVNDCAFKLLVWEMEPSLYVFLNAIPKELVSKAINADNESLVMRTIVQKNYIDTFYRLQYMGVRIDIANRGGKTLEQIINEHRGLQQSLDWGNRKVIQEFIYHFMNFLSFLRDFGRDRTFDSNHAMQLIQNLGNKSVPKEWIETYVNSAIAEVWKSANSHPNNVNTVFLSRIYSLIQALMKLVETRKELFLIAQSRLAFLLGQYSDAQQSLNRFKTLLEDEGSISDRAAKVIQVHYSRLLVSIADAFKVKTSGRLFELSKLSLTDFHSDIIVGEGFFLEGEATVYHLEAIKSAEKFLAEHPVEIKYYGELKKENLKNTDTLRSLYAVFKGLESLNVWLDDVEEKIKTNLFGDESLETIKLSAHNRSKVETFQKFHDVRASIYQFAEKLRTLYTSHIVNVGTDVELKSVALASKQYIDGVKNIAQRELRVAAIACAEESPSNKVAEKPKKKRKQPKPPEPDKKDNNEEEVKRADDYRDLPTYYPGGTYSRPPVLYTPSMASVAQTMFATPRAAITLIAKTPQAEIFYKLKSLGYNHRFPEGLLRFIAKFEPGEIYIVGSSVMYALDNTCALPNDWDLVIDLPLEQLKQKLGINKEDVQDVRDFKVKGEGVYKSYSVIYKSTPEDKALLIDISLLKEKGPNKVERLKQNCQQRDVTVKAMMLDPYAPKKTQLHDFFDGKSHLAERRLVLVKGRLENPLEEFPTRIFRTLLMVVSGWVQSKKDAANLFASIQYLERLSRSRVTKDIKKMYRTFGKEKAESCFKEYNLSGVAMVKVVIDEVSKHPELCRKKEPTPPAEHGTLASLQRAIKQ